MGYHPYYVANKILGAKVCYLSYLSLSLKHIYNSFDFVIYNDKIKLKNYNYDVHGITWNPS